MNLIYEDELFIITQHEYYKYVPGFCVIKEKQKRCNSGDETIFKLAELEKIIRDYLLKKGVELVGIYKEQRNSDFYVYVIPYHVSVLNLLDISPDLYQPFIEKYLNAFDNKYKEQVDTYNKEISQLLKIGR